jgi:His-Xaa-Ser system radical SAM maturase HxsB
VLKAKHFLFDDDSRVTLDLLALKYRTRAERVAEFTALHMFVVTLRCDHSCHYCQVSRQTEDRGGFDMTQEHADLALAHVFRSPAKQLKIEFQGGEPLLNFDLVRYIVQAAVELNQEHRRSLSFVIASNLSRLSDEVLSFCKQYGVRLSTSLDGPRDLHEAQRPLRGASSYDRTVEGIRTARAALGHHSVSALMTTTPASLGRVEEIVDEYVTRGFESIFLRSLSPYGFASRSLVRRYDANDWISFYTRGLRHILALNARGVRMREELASILLQNLLAPGRSGYVDLQSPAGIGIGGIVYNYDGAVYASDEGRMLAEMGDNSLRLGHVADPYSDIMTSAALLVPLESSILESAPMCSDCAFAPACGADPAYYRATQQDWLGHKAFSDFCKKQMAVLELLIKLMESDAATREVLLGWM